MRTHAKGFTLVELSIVLVIIGLLIGGILAAQSMMQTARIGKAIGLFSQLDVAIGNFKTRYNQVPGDSTLFPNPGGNDGVISNASEVGNAFAHLSLGVDFKNSQGSNYQAYVTSTDLWTELNCLRLPLTSTAPGRSCSYLGKGGSFLDSTKNYLHYYKAIDGIFGHGQDGGPGRRVGSSDS